ncbi:hypothetical protein BJI47_13390 [Rhodococcus sp. 1168]|nr:hypothetical protein BJI47_13390 [Rhodococcus sp. 1168]
MSERIERDAELSYTLLRHRHEELQTRLRSTWRRATNRIPESFTEPIVPRHMASTDRGDLFTSILG